LAEWDDRSNRHPEGVFLERHDFLAFVLSEISAGLFWALASWLAGPFVGAVVLVTLVVGFFAAYLGWRRRRNRRLTGSPTRWP
jgi:Flp pilus assembly protein TadB